MDCGFAATRRPGMTKETQDKKWRSNVLASS
jgi:hypothetical protein